MWFQPVLVRNRWWRNSLMCLGARKTFAIFLLLFDGSMSQFRVNMASWESPEMEGLMGTSMNIIYSWWIFPPRTWGMFPSPKTKDVSLSSKQCSSHNVGGSEPAEKCTQQNKANMSHVLGWLVAEDILADAPEVPCTMTSMTKKILKPIMKSDKSGIRIVLLKKAKRHFTGWWWLEHFLFFHSVGNHHPNWRSHIFQRGRLKPPTSLVDFNWCFYPLVI